MNQELIPPIFNRLRPHFVVRFFCLIISLSLLLTINSSLWAAIYYVEATNGNDSNTGLSGTAAWKTIAKVNASRFNPGDQILFKRGEIWRETLVPSSSGSLGSPVTFGHYASGNLPTITGVNIVGPFQQDTQQNVWYASVATQPKVVMFDNMNGRKALSKSGLSSVTDWYWASGVLFVYSSADPGTVYTTVAAGARDWAIAVTTKNYLTFNNLLVQGSNQANIMIVGSGTNHITIDSCEIINSGGNGVVLYETGLGGDHVIKNSTIHHNFNSGINAYKHTGSTAGHETYIQNNEIYGNREAGIEWRGNYGVIEGNVIHDNGTPLATFIGIHIFSLSSSENLGQHNTIQYNRVYNQKGNGQDGAGISIDQWCNYNDVYYNITYNNDGPGIYVFDGAYCRIYNNLAYGNCVNSSGQLTEKGEIRLTASGVPNDLTNYIEVKNNIGYATRPGVFAIYVDSETAPKTLSITNNLWFRPDGNNWYFWNKSGGNNINTWNNISQVGTNLNSDPKFVDLFAYNFGLLSTSPCIDTGVNVNLTRDYAGSPIPKGASVDIGAIKSTPLLSPKNLRISGSNHRGIRARKAYS